MVEGLKKRKSMLKKLILLAAIMVLPLNCFAIEDSTIKK